MTIQSRTGPRTIRLRRGVAAALGVLLVAALATAVVAIRARQDAPAQRDAVISRRLAAQAQSERLTADPPLAALPVAAAWRISPTDEARAGMGAVLNNPGRGVLTGHTNGLSAVVFGPDGRTLASAGGDGTVRLWDVATREQIGDPLRGHVGHVLDVVFSPDGRTLASASHDETVRLWDVAGRKPIGTPFTGHAGGVSAVAFSPDGRMLASAGHDGTVRLWDMVTYEPIDVLFTPSANLMYTVAFSPDGRILAAAGHDGALRLRNATAPDIGDVIKELCAIPARSLTRAERRQYVPELDFQQVCS